MRLRGRPRTGWMDDVKRALNERVMSVEQGRMIVLDLEGFRRQLLKTVGQNVEEIKYFSFVLCFLTTQNPITFLFYTRMIVCNISEWKAVVNA